VNQIERMKVDKVKDVDRLVDLLRRIEADPHYVRGRTLSLIARQAADQIRLDNPIDYSLPETACEGQLPAWEGR
jgi:hypothetical protein